MKVVRFILLFILIAQGTFSQTNCGVDVSAYTGRLAEIWGTTEKTVNDGTVEDVGMLFNLSSPIKVYGFRFYARSISRVQDVECEIWSVVGGLPDRKLAHVKVNIPVSSTLNEYNAIFNKSVDISNDFYLIVSPKFNKRELGIEMSTLGVTFFPINSIIDVGGAWQSAETYYGERKEYNFHPIIEYSVTSNFSIDGDTTINDGDTIYATSGQSLSFAHTSTPIIMNYMFSYRYLHPGNLLGWDFGDGTTDYFPSMTKAYNNPGVYKVTLNDYMEGYNNVMCNSSKYAYVYVAAPSQKSGETSLSNNLRSSNDNPIGVFPNPSNGNFTLKGLKNGDQIEIYTIMGERLFTQVAHEDNLKLDMPGLASGNYLLKVISNTAAFSSILSIH